MWTLKTFIFVLIARNLGAADSSAQGRIALGGGCNGVFEVPHGWTFKGGYGLSAEAAGRPASQGLFYEGGAELSVGRWTDENRPPAASVEQWLVVHIGLFATGHTASVRVTDMPLNLTARRA